MWFPHRSDNGLFLQYFNLFVFVTVKLDFFYPYPPITLDFLYLLFRCLVEPKMSYPGSVDEPVLVRDKKFLSLLSGTSVKSLVSFTVRVVSGSHGSGPLVP